MDIPPPPLFYNFIVVPVIDVYRGWKADNVPTNKTTNVILVPDV